MLSRIQQLARLPLFANLTLRELSDIIAHLHEGNGKRGDTLITEGAPPGTPLYVLLQGSAATIKQTCDGRPHIVGTLHAPNVFGEMDVLAQRPALASVVALEPVHFATLSAEAVRTLCEAARPCILKVLNNLSTALRYRTVASETRLQNSDHPAGPRLGAMRRMLYSGWDNRR